MAEPVSICPTSEIPENGVKKFEVGNYALAVYHVDGAFYATDDECTHGCASLAEGELDGHVIECGLHFGAFDIRTGAAVQAPCFTPVRTYKVEVRDGQIFVDLEKEAGQ